MAAAYLNDCVNGSDNSMSTSIGQSYTRTSGSTIIAAVTWETTDTTCTMSGTGTSGWTSIAKIKNAGQNFWLELFWGKADSSGTNDLGATLGSAADYKAILIFGFTGLDATAPVATSTADTETASSVTSISLSPDLTVPGAGVSIAAIASWNSTSTWTPPSGFTRTQAGVMQFIDCAYKLQTGSGSQAVTYTSNATTYLVLASVSLVEVAGGGGGNYWRNAFAVIANQTIG